MDRQQLGINEAKILLLVEHQRNRQLLSQALAEYYEVLAPEVESDFAEVGKQMLKSDFDLCFIDYTAIHLLRAEMLAKREIAVPIYLPFVFLTTQQNVGISTNSLELLIDDLIYLPAKKIELRTKIRVLLRSRSYSLQLKAAREKLNRALVKEKELNEIKSSFISKVSHDFRNPLNSISGMAQILEAYGDKLTPEKKAEVLQQLRRNVTKMTNLLDDVLLISQKEMGKLQSNRSLLKLETFCQGVVSEIQAAFSNKQTINFVYRAERAEFNLDDKLLNYILTNLLSNACKYSPQDSIVDFEIYSHDSELTLTIADRGIGIPSEDIPHLFDAFYRASNSQGYQGTGLGLAIAKEYVELHQGTISIESELEVGTTFIVKIPV